MYNFKCNQNSKMRKKQAHLNVRCQAWNVTIFPKSIWKWIFLYYIKEWSKLSDKIRNTKIINKFKVAILNFIRPKGNLVLDVHDTNVNKLPSRLRLNFSHSNKHKFRHKFKGKLELMCTCCLEPDTTFRYLLRCNLYSTQRLELF